MKYELQSINICILGLKTSLWLAEKYPRGPRYCGKYTSHRTWVRRNCDYNCVSHSASPGLIPSRRCRTGSVLMLGNRWIWADRCVQCVVVLLHWHCQPYATVSGEGDGTRATVLASFHLKDLVFKTRMRYHFQEFFIRTLRTMDRLPDRSVFCLSIFSYPSNYKWTLLYTF